MLCDDPVPYEELIVFLWLGKIADCLPHGRRRWQRLLIDATIDSSRAASRSWICRKCDVVACPEQEEALPVLGYAVVSGVEDLVVVLDVIAKVFEFLDHLFEEEAMRTGC